MVESHQGRVKEAEIAVSTIEGNAAVLSKRANVRWREWQRNQYCPTGDKQPGVEAGKAQLEKDSDSCVKSSTVF